MMEGLGQIVTVLGCIVIILLAMRGCTVNTEEWFNHGVCESMHNVSSCEIIYIPNTEVELKEKFDLWDREEKELNK